MDRAVQGYRASPGKLPKEFVLELDFEDLDLVHRCRSLSLGLLYSAETYMHRALNAPVLATGGEVFTPECIPAGKQQTGGFHGPIILVTMPKLDNRRSEQSYKV